MIKIKCPITCPNDLMRPVDGVCFGCNVPMFIITCKCGHNDIHEYYETYDSEPSNLRYQCPECGIEWSINGLKRARRKQLEKEINQIIDHNYG